MFSSGNGAKRGGFAYVPVATVLAGLALFTPSANAGRLWEATRSTGAQGPPVVTERLGSALPCNQQTQIGLDGCAEKGLLAADKLLNATSRSSGACSAVPVGATSSLPRARG